MNALTQTIFKDAQATKANETDETNPKQQLQRMFDSFIRRMKPQDPTTNPDKPETQTSVQSPEPDQEPRTTPDESDGHEFHLTANALREILNKLQRRAEILKNLPEELDSLVLIGQARVPERRITWVGDLDGNGYVDAMVASPHARNETGGVRLYLMTEGGAFLYTRDIQPGYSGFDSEPLRPGDRFGNFIVPLHTNGGQKGMPNNGVMVAIGAPGDGVGGSVYVLKISNRGDVVKHVKTTLDRVQGVEQRDAEAAGSVESEIKEEADVTVAPKNYTEDLSDVHTILFEAADGEILAALKVNAKADAQILKHIQEEYFPLPSLHTHRSTQVSPTKNEGANEEHKRTGRKVLQEPRNMSMEDNEEESIECYINETHCNCDYEDGGSEEARRCLQFSRLNALGADSQQATYGTAICKYAKCPKRLRCRCDGQKLCKRVQTQSTVWTAMEEAKSPDTKQMPQEAEVHCNQTVQVVSTAEMVMINGSAPLLLRDGMLPHTTMQSLPIFNETNCVCSQKRQVLSAKNATGNCLTFSHMHYGLAIYCNWRACLIGDGEYACDTLGSSYCERRVEDSRRWVYDGPVVGEPDTVYCHKAHRSSKKTSFLFKLS